jgi:type IV secretion system protein TrbL
MTWTANIWPYANTLFGILATIEFAWSAAVMLLEKADLQSWTSAIVRKMMWIGAFYALLLNGRTWIPTIIDSFEQIGQTASGFNQIAPSDIFAEGIDIAGALMATSSTAAFFQNLGTSLAMIVAAALVVLAFTGITIQFIVAMVESYIIVAAGFIFLGFGGSRWTVPYTERYLGLAFSVGLKIMLLYLLIATGMGLSTDWMTDAQNVSLSINPAMSAFEIMGAALIFLMLCWQIPKLFAAVLGGSPALSGGDLLATAAGVATGVAAVGSLVGSSTRVVGEGVGAISRAVAAGQGSAGTGALRATGLVTSQSSAGSSGSPPPLPGGSFGPSAGRSPRQPNPPSTAGLAGLSPQERVSAIGGEPLGGSGFESEHPAVGFVHSLASDATGAPASNSEEPRSSNSPPGQGPAVSGLNPSSEIGPRGTPLRGIPKGARRRSRFSIFPSDAASHAQPPRMPVDHEE